MSKQRNRIVRQWVALGCDRTYLLPVGRLFLLFTVVPLVELYLLVRVGSVLGAGPTIALVLLTGALGAWFARLEGLRVLRRWQESLARQELPKDGVFDGLLIFVGGLMLITPGILTDIAGLCMVMPLTRRGIVAMLRRWVERQIATGRVQVFTTEHGYRRPPRPDVIDVEGEVIDVELRDVPPRQFDRR